VALRSDPLIGTELAGYRIQSVVGKGGMSVVYLAEHERLHRKAALKVLAPELAENESFRDRFLRESEIAAQLDHENVIPIFDAGEADGVLYIAMRYVEGTDLRERLKRDGALEPVRALAILAQVAGALDAAHGRGLVHRDVKPANVLLAGSEHVYLADFGLSKQASSISGLTATGQFVGTVDYVAPEQIQGDSVDARADEYALGCVLYECLTGETPFPRSSSIAVLWAHVEDEPPSLVATRPELPEALDAVMKRALAKNPDERFGSCRELVEAAREAIAPAVVAVPEQPAVAAPPPDRPAPGKHRWSRRWVIAAVAVLLVAAAVAAALVLTLGGGGSVVVVPNSLVRIDPETNDIVEVVPVGNWPDQVVAAGQYLFVVNVEDATVSRLDTTSGQLQTFGAADNPVSLGVEDENRIWIGSNTTPEVVRVGAETLRVQRRVRIKGVAATWMAIGDGSLWVTSHPAGAGCAEVEGTSQVDLATGRVVRTVVTGRCPNAVAHGEEAAWVVNAAESTVTRIDPATGAMESFETGHQAGSVMAGLGSVWVTSDYDDSVWRLNPVTGSPQAIIPVGDLPWGIVADDGAVWVTSHGPESPAAALPGQIEPAGTLVRIDPDTNKVVATIDLGQYANAVTAGPGGIWVAVAGKDFPDV
jgi:streptogramin lyase/predicted Ser/Thr protein kinase